MLFECYGLQVSDLENYETKQETNRSSNKIYKRAYTKVVCCATEMQDLNMHLLKDNKVKQQSIQEIIARSINTTLVNNQISLKYGVERKVPRTRLSNLHKTNKARLC